VLCVLLYREHQLKQLLQPLGGDANADSAATSTRDLEEVVASAHPQRVDAADARAVAIALADAERRHEEQQLRLSLRVSCGGLSVAVTPRNRRAPPPDCQSAATPLRRNSGLRQ
jgi:hypothetical protein